MKVFDANVLAYATLLLLNCINCLNGDTGPLCYYVPGSPLPPSRLREEVRDEPPWWIALVVIGALFLIFFGVFFCIIYNIKRSKKNRRPKRSEEQARVIEAPIALNNNSRSQAPSPLPMPLAVPVPVTTYQNAYIDTNILGVADHDLDTQLPYTIDTSLSYDYYMQHD